MRPAAWASLSEQNKRPYNEDRVQCGSLTYGKGLAAIPFLIVDGHAGDDTAELVRSLFETQLCKQLKSCGSEVDIAAKVSSFGQFCEEKACKDRLKGGCCVLIGVMWGRLAQQFALSRAADPSMASTGAEVIDSSDESDGQAFGRISSLRSSRSSSYMGSRTRRRDGAPGILHSDSRRPGADDTDHILQQGAFLSRAVRLGMVIGHAGDCRAALVRAGGGSRQCIQLTRDHSPCDPEEKRRIERAGGSIEYANGKQRVMPMRLAVARSIGLCRHKIPGLPRREQILYPELEMGGLDIDPRNARLLIMATDGLWDRLPTHAAPAVLRRARLLPGLSALPAGRHRKQAVVTGALLAADSSASSRVGRSAMDTIDEQLLEASKVSRTTDQDPTSSMTWHFSSRVAGPSTAGTKYSAAHKFREAAARPRPEADRGTDVSRSESAAEVSANLRKALALLGRAGSRERIASQAAGAASGGGHGSPGRAGGSNKSTGVPATDEAAFESMLASSRKRRAKRSKGYGSHLYPGDHTSGEEAASGSELALGSSSPAGAGGSLDLDLGEGHQGRRGRHKGSSLSSLDRLKSTQTHRPEDLQGRSSRRRGRGQDSPASSSVPQSRDPGRSTVGEVEEVAAASPQLDTESVCRVLADYAMRKGSLDNVTLLAVDVPRALRRIVRCLCKRALGAGGEGSSKSGGLRGSASLEPEAGGTGDRGRRLGGILKSASTRSVGRRGSEWAADDEYAESTLSGSVVDEGSSEAATGGGGGRLRTPDGGRRFVAEAVAPSSGGAGSLGTPHSAASDMMDVVQEEGGPEQGGAGGGQLPGVGGIVIYD